MYGQTVEEVQSAAVVIASALVYLSQERLNELHEVVLEYFKDYDGAGSWDILSTFNEIVECSDDWTVVKYEWFDRRQIFTLSQEDGVWTMTEEKL